MQRKHRDFFIKLAAVLSLTLSILASLGIIAVIVFLSIKSSEYNISKLFVAFLVMILLMVFMLMVGIAFYEFFLSYIKMEDEVTTLEHEVGELEKIEQANGNVASNQTEGHIEKEGA